jgi:hypothetical protein
MELDWILLVSRWLHIVAAIFAVGGALFMRVALIPAAKQELDDARHEALREAVRRRWAMVVQACIAVLLVTGGLNFVILAWPPKVEPMPYHAIFGVKLLAALGVFFLGSVLVGRSAGMAHMRQNSGKWLTALVLLGVLIVFISGILSQVRQAG